MRTHIARTILMGRCIQLQGVGGFGVFCFLCKTGEFDGGDYRK